LLPNGRQWFTLSAIDGRNFGKIERQAENLPTNLSHTQPNVVSLSKIGIRFNRDIATMSRIVNKIEKRMKEEKSYKGRILQYYNNAIAQAMTPYHFLPNGFGRSVRILSINKQKLNL
jgi:hypothetical protein